MQGRPAVNSEACADSTDPQNDLLEMYLVDCWANAAKRQHFLRLLDGKIADANVPDQALQSCQTLGNVVALPDSCLSYLPYNFMLKGPQSTYCVAMKVHRAMRKHDSESTMRRKEIGQHVDHLMQRGCCMPTHVRGITSSTSFSIAVHVSLTEGSMRSPFFCGSVTGQWLCTAVLPRGQAGPKTML